MLITIKGASKSSEFNTPHSVITDQPLILSPFGDLSVYLASSTSKDRFYQITFTSETDASVFLAGFDVRGIGWHNL
jgi:hypothetical protein